MSRQGGWRRLEGRLPVAAASSFAVSVPQANTDVRFANIPDRSNHTTTEDGETIRVALPETGMILLQFRPQVAAAEVDRSLTARSEGVFDVQEDGLRLAWQIQYEFRQGRRSTLSAILPSGYLLEKVLGDNVRGWDVNDTGRLDVELLKDVTEQEAITVFLSRRRRLLDGDSAEIELPLVGVPDAMLHTGTVSVRRSPRLELSVGQQVQLIRDNGDAAAAERLMKLAGEESSPLTIRPFQTFRFASENYSATVTARSIADRTEANVESIVRISPRQTEWEMRVQFDVKQIPRHVVELDLPAEFEIRSLSQADWVTSTTEGRQTVTVYLGSAESGPFDLVLNGVLPPMGGDGNVALPSVLVADVVRQTGELVVQVDPAYRVQPTNLDGAAVVPLERANDWLTPEQFALARGGIVLQLSKADYQGNLLVTRREPDVRVTTLTNVKVTDQSIEETILLEFRVLEAGIRDVRFRLPASMAAARFRVPSLRAKSVAPAANAPELVDVLLEFQDDLMDEIRIVIENDRLASSGPQTVPIPRIQTGIVEQQYVTLQNQGRDELIVESAEGLTALANSQRRWRSLVDLDITQGYEVNRGATDPLLQFRSQVRETLKTADARIDHSEITIVVDAAGTYRAKHLFYVENNTEPYLQIQLPTDSSLWTTHVDGQPVKPAVVPDQEREVRIPLVRTQLGDSDYPVQVIYAGSIENLTSLSQVKFPFVRTVNINVERTQVALHLPEDFRWINFRGATQTNREEFALGFQMYLEKEIASQAQNLKSGSKYQQQRAAATLRQLEEQVQQSAQEAVDDGKLARQQLRNWQSVEDAQRAAMEQAEQSQVEGLETDNRAALNDLFSNQRYNRATNIVTNKGDNFEDAYRVVDESKDQAGAAAEEGQFNKKWLGSNSLSLDGHADAKRTDSKPSSKGKSEKAQAAAERTQANRRGINNNAAFDNIQRQIDRLNQTRQSGEQQMERLPAGENVFDGPANAGNGQQRGGGRGPGLDRSSPQFDLGFLRDAPRGNTRQGQAGGGFGAQQQMGQAAMPAGMAGQASGQGLGFDEDDSPPFAATSNAETTGSLASVDLEIPERGTVFYFQATRGKVELTAQPVNSSSSWNLATFIACLIGLAVVWFATRQSDSN